MIFLIAIVFCAAFLILPGLAENEVYFTAINNTLLELNDKTMPVKLKGVFYVPNTVFNSSELGTYCVYSRSKQLVMLSDLEHILYFDMSEGTCYDDDGESYPYVAIYQNDTAYLPALFTAFYYGIEYSYINSDYAPIIRLTKGEVLSDSAFLRGAAAIMESRLALYQAAKQTATPAPTPDTTPSTDVAPTTAPTSTPVPTEAPTPTPSVQPTASPRPNRSNVIVYIAFLGLSEDSTEYADILRARGFSTCFFVCVEDILQYPAVIRKLLGTGCSIGILFSDDPAEESAAASRLLREAAHTVTFIAAAAHELSPEAEKKAQETGLHLWCTQAPESDPEILIDQLEQAGDRYDLILDGSINKKNLNRLLEYLISESYTIGTISEMTESAYGR